MHQRNTVQRKEILEVLKNTRSHPTAEWIYGEVRKIRPDISLGTVYRNLKVLRNQGKVLELHDGSKARYDGTVKPHTHFICEKCREITDLPLSGNFPSWDCLKNHRINSVHVLFYGRCPECRS